MMKKILVSLLVGVIIGGAVVFFLLNQNTPQKLESSVKNSFYEVTSKLDLGGNVYGYLSTERLLKGIEEFALKLRKIVEGQIDRSEPDQMELLNGYDFVFSLVKNFGLFDISGLGISSITLGKNLNHTKMVVHHYKDAEGGLLWHFMEDSPHALTELNLLPADTVLAGCTDMNLNRLWNWIKKEAEASGSAKIKEAVLSVEPSLKNRGFDLARILDSLAGRVGMVLTLDRSQKNRIPSGQAVVEIPEPALAIFFTVKDDFIFKFFQGLVGNAAGAENGEEGIIRIPVPPLPVPVAPVIVQKDALLILASNEKIVKAMLDAERSGEGLTSSDEFKKLSAHIPDEGNSFRFIGSRFVATLKDIQKNTIGAMPTGEEGQDVSNLMEQLFPTELALYGVLQHNPDGYISFFNHTINLESVFLLPATMVTGVVAAVAIPNLLTAVQKGKQNVTMANMRMIALALEAYIVDQGYAPTGKTLAEIRGQLEPNYVKSLILEDGWGHAFLYRHGTGLEKATYMIASPGKDGQFLGFEQNGRYHVATIKDFGHDIIFSNGSFLYAPENY